MDRLTAAPGGGPSSLQFHIAWWFLMFLKHASSPPTGPSVPRLWEAAVVEVVVGGGGGGGGGSASGSTQSRSINAGHARPCSCVASKTAWHGASCGLESHQTACCID